MRHYSEAMVVHVHANCQVPQSCSSVAIEVVGTVALVAKDQKFNQGKAVQVDIRLTLG